MLLCGGSGGPDSQPGLLCHSAGVGLLAPTWSPLIPPWEGLTAAGWWGKVLTLQEAICHTTPEKRVRRVPHNEDGIPDSPCLFHIPPCGDEISLL